MRCDGPPRLRRAALWALLYALLSGCGPAHGEAFLLPFRAGQRAYAAGRYDEAAGHFEQAAATARRVKDRDEALFLRARMFERLERWQDAAVSYRRILEVSPNGPRAGRAAFELATLEIEHGEAREGWAALARAIERFPRHGSASRAIVLWSEHTAETAGEEALRAQLARWEESLAATPSAQRAKYERARSFRRSGKLSEAHQAFVRAAREHPYPTGNLFDDAMWFAAEVAEAMGDRRQAMADLEELLASREVTVGASYERPRFPAAQMRIAELYREMGELQKARAAFHLMHQNHETSILADDAMWQEALMALRLGDREGACEAAEALDDHEPRSRYLRCLHLICEQRPKQRCPGYIVETLEPPAGEG